jgi:threonine/homoserine/homoserine lactone efflux protein
MPSFVPDLAALIPFLVAALTLNLTPGADMTYVIARSAGQGRGAGVSSALGIAAGSFLHSLLAAVGLSASPARSCSSGCCSTSAARW